MAPLPRTDSPPRRGHAVAEAAAVLGVLASAGADELRAAYRRRALETHPDKAGGSAEAFRHVHIAFELLSRSRTALSPAKVSRPRARASSKAAPGPTSQTPFAGSAAGRERTPRRRQQRQPRKPAAKAPPPRQLSPRAVARSLGIFPQSSAASFGLVL